MASTSGSAPAPTGCYKCGRPGHWSKDCNAPSVAAAGGSGPPGSSSTFNSSGGIRRGSSLPTYNSGKSSKPGSSYNKSAPKDVAPKLPRTRPKLTADLLLSENGLGYVLEKMPDMVTIKGREDTVVRDLKSVLEGYMRWHSHILPYFSFDQFIEKVEKLGSTKRVRMCTRELREKIVHGKGVNGESDAGDIAHSASKDANPAQSPVDAERDVEPASGTNDSANEDEAAIPVSEVDFEDFFKQGVSEMDTSKDDSASEKRVDDQPTERSAGTSDAVAPQVISKSSTISEAAAARMEANRLQALERLRARKAQEQQS